MIILETDVLVRHHHDALRTELLLLAGLLLGHLLSTGRIYRRIALLLLELWMKKLHNRSSSTINRFERFCWALRGMSVQTLSLRSNRGQRWWTLWVYWTEVLRKWLVITLVRYNLSIENASRGRACRGYSRGCVMLRNDALCVILEVIVWIFDLLSLHLDLWFLQDHGLVTWYLCLQLFLGDGRLLCSRPTTYRDHLVQSRCFVDWAVSFTEFLVWWPVRAWLVRVKGYLRTDMWAAKDPVSIRSFLDSVHHA